MSNPTRTVAITRYSGAQPAPDDDLLAVEEPLDIQLGYISEGQRRHRTFGITMRTPGSDEELAVGLLAAEGVIRQPEDVLTVLSQRNAVRVELAPHIAVDWARLERIGITTAACGVCGRATLDSLPQAASRLITSWAVPAAVVCWLTAELRKQQAVFDQTGGLHAAALFSQQGDLLRLREDVGRHNALDKLVGSYFQESALPLDRHLLLVSGRASFELVQKAVAAGIQWMAAVGAPSSLAVDLAVDAGLTLVGFLRDSHFNVYSGSERVSV